MRVAVEALLGNTELSVIGGQIPDDEGLVAGSGQQDVGVLEGGGQALFRASDPLFFMGEPSRCSWKV